MLTTCFASSVSSADATMSLQQDSIKGDAVAAEESRYVTMPHWSCLSFSCYYRCENDVSPGFGDQLSVFFSSNLPNMQTGSNFRNFAPTFREAAATAEEREASPTRNKQTDASKIQHETGDKLLNVGEKRFMNDLNGL